MATSATSETEVKKNATSRNFALTWNNYPEDHVEVLQARYNNDDRIRYIIAGREIAPSTGTPHLQMTVCMWEGTKTVTITKMFPGCHNSGPCFKPLRNNTNYCSKDNDFFEIGDRPAQGRRTDLISCKRRLDAGVKHMDLAQDDEFYPHVAKYHSFFSKYEQYIRGQQLKTNRDVPLVYVRVGPAGTGKSRWLDNTFGLTGYVTAPDNTGKWFDGCDDSDVVLFDDVETGEIPPIGLFKKLTDRRPLKVAVKGGFIWWKPRVIVFTSNQHWHFWWDGISDANKKAIERRITEVIIVT